MAFPKAVLILALISTLHVASTREYAREYTFGELWGGDIELSAFPFGVENLVANISVYANETVAVRIYSTDDVTLTLTVGEKKARRVVGNNETISVVAPEDASTINISIVNTKDHPVVVFRNSTITIYLVEAGHTESSTGSIVLSREMARICGVAAVIVPIIIMVVRARKRRVVAGDEGLLEYVGGS